MDIETIILFIRTAMANFSIVRSITPRVLLQKVSFCNFKRIQFQFHLPKIKRVGQVKVITAKIARRSGIPLEVVKIHLELIL